MYRLWMKGSGHSFCIEYAFCRIAGGTLYFCDPPVYFVCKILIVYLFNCFYKLENILELI
ncbi:MAG: hypothetical protein VR69_02510 [Peptococcaceae bacterium BRH_c4b]|nr:MAG: hypothetical protein VR69_02510 [Peptococcaceae bacterium BRH_c4b]